MLNDWLTSSVLDCSASSSLNTASAIGDRQILPEIHENINSLYLGYFSMFILWSHAIWVKVQNFQNPEL